jgi:hypothetical protein
LQHGAAIAVDDDRSGRRRIRFSPSVPVMVGVSRVMHMMHMRAPVMSCIGRIA